MATKEEIKNAILKTAGNPSVGIIADMAEELAKAVWEIDNKNFNSPAKEARVIDIKETR
jgi:hypothetical protein